MVQVFCDLTNIYMTMSESEIENGKLRMDFNTPNGRAMDTGRLDQEGWNMIDYT